MTTTAPASLLGPGVAARLQGQAVQLAVIQITRLAAGTTVRITRGGYRGELATVTGDAAPGGYTVTHEAGMPMAFEAAALEVVEGA